jgi:hypothetical protein
MKRSLHDGAFLVVEGGSDKHVYKLVLDEDRCRIEIACGRDNVFGAIRLLNADDFQGVFGVVDADFMHVTGERILEENILWTDFHDLECMVLNSPAFDRILDEFASENRLQTYAIPRSRIARQLAASAAPLGCLRLISIQEGLDLKCEGLTFSRFVEGQPLLINFAAMIREIINKSQKHELDQEQLLAQVTAEVQKEHDCWQISCGHDIVEILSVLFREVLSGKSGGQFAVDVLERSLRIAYHAGFLKETLVYRAMERWEQHHPEFPILQR